MSDVRPFFDWPLTPRWQRRLDDFRAVADRAAPLAASAFADGMRALGHRVVVRETGARSCAFWLRAIGRNQFRLANFAIEPFAAVGLDVFLPRVTVSLRPLAPTRRELAALGLTAKPRLDAERWRGFTCMWSQVTPLVGWLALASDADFYGWLPPYEPEICVFSSDTIFGLDGLSDAARARRDAEIVEVRGAWTVEALCFFISRTAVCGEADFAEAAAKLPPPWERDPRFIDPIFGRARGDFSASGARGDFSASGARADFV